MLSLLLLRMYSIFYCFLCNECTNNINNCFIPQSPFKFDPQTYNSKFEIFNKISKKIEFKRFIWKILVKHTKLISEFFLNKYLSLIIIFTTYHNHLFYFKWFFYNFKEQNILALIYCLDSLGTLQFTQKKWKI